MEKLQALLRGRRVRAELVSAVREEYEGLVNEIEGGDRSRYTYRLVDWPRKRTLCFPVFPDIANQPRPEKAVHRENSPKPLETEIQTRVPQDDLVSLSPLSSSQDSSQSETLTVVPTLSSAPHNTQNSSEEKEIERVVELGSKGGEGAGYVDKRTRESEAADLLAELLSSQPLVRGDLPRDRESLQELRLQTEMELVWVRQAISSRRKYLQLKDKIKAQ